jgi:hypothetical protein
MYRVAVSRIHWQICLIVLTIQSPKAILQCYFSESHSMALSPADKEAAVRPLPKKPRAHAPNLYNNLSSKSSSAQCFRGSRRLTRLTCSRIYHDTYCKTGMDAMSENSSGVAFFPSTYWILSLFLLLLVAHSFRAFFSARSVPEWTFGERWCRVLRIGAAGNDAILLP